MQIRSTNSVGTAGGIKFLVFGPAGSGKTRLCATMPNPIILSAEGGLLSLRNSNLPFIEIKNVAEFTQAWLWVSQSAEARKFNSICIDSVSEIAENELTYAKSQTKDGRKAYGDTQEQVERILKNFRNLQGPHVYFSAKQKMTASGEDGKLVPGVMMPGNNLGQAAPFMFDEVFQLVPSKTAEGKFFSALRTRGINEWDTVKDRSGSLEEWEAADLGAIINKIMAKV